MRYFESNPDPGLSQAQIKALYNFAKPGGHGYGEYAYLSAPTAKALAKMGLVVLSYRQVSDRRAFPWGEITDAGRAALARHEGRDIRSNPQKHTSAATSQKQLAGLFKTWQGMRGFKGINLDLGGGKHDLAQEWMDRNNIPCVNLVVDPFNRSEAHNREMLARVVTNGGADSVTIANVLNVIDDLEARLQIMKQADNYAKPGAPIIISVYERNKDGAPTVTKADSWQANRKLEAYLPEVQAILNSSQILPGKGLIVARGSGNPEGVKQYREQWTRGS